MTRSPSRPAARSPTRRRPPSALRPPAPCPTRPRPVPSDASTVTATDSDTLAAHATLGITKTDGVTSVTAGTTDTYTVVVSNTGPSDASNLSVVDTLPSQGFTNISSPNLPSGVTFTAATDTWTLASLPAGQSVTLQLAGTVPSGATGATYVNTASASASDASTVTATDSDTLASQATLSHHQDRQRRGIFRHLDRRLGHPGDLDHLHHRGLELRALDGHRSIGHRPAGSEPVHRLRHLDGHRIRWGHRLQRLGLRQHRRLGDHPGRRLGHLHGDGRHPVLGHRHPDQYGHGLGLGRLDRHGHRLRQSRRPSHPGHHQDRQRRGFVIPPHCRFGSPWYVCYLHHRRLELRAFDCHRSISHRPPGAQPGASASDAWTATATGGTTGFSPSGSGTISDRADHSGRRFCHLYRGRHHRLSGHREPSRTRPLPRPQTPQRSRPPTPTA